MDKPIGHNPMEPLPFSDENRLITGKIPMKLQLFADDSIDWRRIYEKQPPEDWEGGIYPGAPIFKTPNENSTDDPTTDDDLDDEESEIREPIFMPRLSITDKNLSYLSNGEMVIADEEGNLSTASVDEGGALSTTPLQINGEMIQEESIPGSKLMENAITSRELDMEDLFSDSALLNQLVAANIDTDDLFLNDQFIEKLTDRIAAHPIDSLQIVDGAITRAKIGDAAIGTAKIDEAAITSAKIQDAAIISAKIADAAIGTAKIDEAAITSAKIQDAAIISAKIADAAIGTAKIDEAAITSAKIQDAAIISAKIADAAIGTAKIEDAAIKLAKIEEATINNLKAGSIDALTARINQIVAGSITTDTLYAAIADIVALRVQQITAETINADELYAALANVVKLRVDEAVAGEVTTDELRTALASIADAQIESANIEQLLVDQAIISKGVGGEIYISRLAVTQGNIVNLTVGQLVVRGNEDGKYYHISVNSEGEVVTTPVEMAGDNIAEGAIDGHHIVEDSITTEHLDADEIFGNEAIIAKITSEIITTGQFFANEGVVNKLNSWVIAADTIQSIRGQLNLHVGGSNLARNSQFIKDSAYWNLSAGVIVDASKTNKGGISTKHLQTGLDTDTWNGVYQTNDACIPCGFGDAFSASVLVQIEDPSTLMDGSVFVAIDELDSTYAVLKSTKSEYIPLSDDMNKWIPLHCTRTSTEENVAYVKMSFGVKRNGTCWFTCPKMERGNLPSDWSPASEDVDGRITENETNITQTQTAISLKADKTVMEGLATRMTSAEQKISDNAIISTVSSKLVVGGRNLLKKSDWEVQATKDEFASITGLSNALVDGYDLQSLIGKQLTLSFFVHTSGAGVDGTGSIGNRFGIHGAVVWRNDSGGTTMEYPMFDMLINTDVSKKRVFCSGVITPPAGYTQIQSMTISIQPNRKPASTNNEVWLLARPKLELGSVATDWSPAPEDYKDDLKAQVGNLSTSISQTATAITQCVSKNDQAKYLTFDATNGVVIGDSTSNYKMQILSDRLNITQNGLPVAYFASNKLFIDQGELTSLLTIGNYSLTKTTDGGIAIG
jgi:uncharacterized protein YjbI with pentapeptide repeats